MRYIINHCTDPAFNLAAEEWLLTNTNSEIFMLWRNQLAVIVGRNQNTLSQIDESYVREHDIPVIRRLSGGGAVFHDLGNINFTFISPNKGDKGLDFKRFTTPILDALRQLGISGSFDGRNDLVIDGRKISGNAQHIHKDRVLHHGTLLFSSNIADISGALRVDPEKYRDKAVKSVSKRVTNIAENLPSPMDVTEFMEHLMAHVSQGKSQADMALTEGEIHGIEELAAQRYRTWEWNYGGSPDYGFCRSTRTPGGVVEVHLDVQSGAIARARLYGDYFGVRDIAELEAQLIGCRHDRNTLAAKLADVPLNEYLMGIELEVLLDCLF